MRLPCVAPVLVLLLACTHTGCALKCPWCTYERTRADCLEQTQFRDKGEGWKNRCDTKAACDAGKAANPAACKLEDSVFSCVSCCDEDGCVGGAAETKISLPAMAAAAFLVIAKTAMLL
ncbi:Hypp4718 [Branchiostoma lanceolatum]|uniref:Hypp4718 protein n=1 Tax=Branchiostoma lanceolatum TaxID=7740 RepID=A0A8K0A9I1_BRALA|nr:Hypp4718 [Branchiostoma lanceolatum]